MYKHVFFIFIFMIFSLFYLGCEQGMEPIGENQGTMEELQISTSSNLLWPAGATLNSATFSIFSNFATENAVVEVFALTTDWTENGVTWNWADFGINWTTPGGDIGVKVGEFNVVAGSAGWHNVDITALVSDWISGGSSNFGILLKQGFGNTGYHSSEYGSISQRPKFTIDYTVNSVNTIAVIQRGTNEDVFDSWFSVINPDENNGQANGLLTRFTPPIEKRTVLKFPFEVEYVPPPECETAFAFGGSGIASCFILWDEFSNWGWTNGPLGPGNYTFDVYAGAGQCDLTKGTLVGDVTIDFDGFNATVTYNMDSDFTMSETHLYIGNDPFPTNKKGNITNAPGQFPFIHDDLNNANSDSFTVTGLYGPIYVIAHAVVCGQF